MLRRAYRSVPSACGVACTLRTSLMNRNIDTASATISSSSSSNVFHQTRLQSSFRVGANANGWTCATCMARNSNGSTSCVRCGNEKDGFGTAGAVPGRQNNNEDGEGRGGDGNSRAPRHDDWTCSSCNTVNAAFRSKCFRCREPKESNGLMEEKGGLALGARARSNKGSQLVWLPLHLAAQSGRAEAVRQILETEGWRDVNVGGPEYWSPLHCAARYGRLEALELLLGSGAKTELYTAERLTPMHLAAQYGHTDVVDALIKADANVDSWEEDKWTSLHYAAQDGYLDVAELLLDAGAKINAKTSHGESPLHFACQQGNVELVQTLLDNGALVDMEADNSWRALHCAAEGGHLDVVEVLIKEKRAQVDPVTKSFQRPVNLAAANGHTTVVKFLLENGSPVNPQTAPTEAEENNADDDEVTRFAVPPLVSACGSEGKVEIVELLCTMGAEIDAETPETKLSALDVAARDGNLEVVNVLIGKKANVNHQSNVNVGWYTLHHAAHQGRAEVVKRLIEAGADITSTNGNKRTALHAGVGQNGSVEAVRAILAKAEQKGGKAEVDRMVNAKTQNTMSPLHIACQEDNADMVELLLANGSKLEEVSTKGWTPLFYAVTSGRSDVVSTLVKHGANVDSVNKEGRTALDMATSAAKVTSKQLRDDTLELLRDKTKVGETLQEGEGMDL